jgi:hypothetical protein
MSDDKPLYELNAAEHGYLPHQWTFGRETRSCEACGSREAHWDDAEYPIDPCMARNVQVFVENAYSDGHGSTHEAWVAAPQDPDDLEDWWQDEVFEVTGDGHGAENPKLGSYYKATIIAAGVESLVGLTCEWD